VATTDTVSTEQSLDWPVPWKQRRSGAPAPGHEPDGIDGAAMIAPPRSTREVPWVALGAIRVVNGALALVAPKTLMTRLGVDAANNRAAVYGLRMFGIRTMLIGLDLLTGDEEVRGRTVRRAPLIHGCDTASAVVAGLRGDLPRRAAVLATAISGINLVLALLAWRAQRAAASGG
jgi:hypothetical protein